MVQRADLAGATGVFQDASCDRFISTYVFDLLGIDDAKRMLGEAARILADGGGLGLVSLGPGDATGVTAGALHSRVLVARRRPR